MKMGCLYACGDHEAKTRDNSERRCNVNKETNRSWLARPSCAGDQEAIDCANEV